MFAVFEAKGFQYLGSPGEKLKIPRLDSELGDKVSFDKVLLVKNGDTKIGQPYIEGASITAKIIEHGRYKKIIVFKFKKRNRYRRKKGHRQTYTEIEIKDIILGGKVTTRKKGEKEEVKQETCCGPPPPEKDWSLEDDAAPWIVGTLDTPVGPVPVVGTSLNWSDRLGAWKFEAVQQCG